MGFFKRAAEIVESRVNKFLDKVEDPNATLDLSYEKMLDGLQQVKSHLADVVTEQKSIELQIKNAEKEVVQREEEAKAAIRLNREDLATAALEGKQQATGRLAQLNEAHDRIKTQADRLKDAERKFKDRIHSFKTQKEVTKATYQAAKAEVRIGESMSGIGKELGGIGETLRRANDKAEQMSARAAAMESLTEEGILDDVTDNRDSVAKELDKIRRDAAVADDLERLKKELQSGS
jgi:phage shock protein A